MPVVFRHKGFRFYFFSNEGNPREPVHIHVMKDGIDAKFWLWPDVVVAYNDGFSAKALRELIEIVSHRRQFLTSAWNEFFGESD
jgi:hypothetical protein